MDGWASFFSFSLSFYFRGTGALLSRANVSGVAWHGAVWQERLDALE
jgi:hypothetical protein